MHFSSPNQNRNWLSLRIPTQLDSHSKKHWFCCCHWNYQHWTHWQSHCSRLDSPLYYQFPLQFPHPALTLRQNPPGTRHTTGNHFPPGNRFPPVYGPGTVAFPENSQLLAQFGNWVFFLGLVGEVRNRNCCQTLGKVETSPRIHPRNWLVAWWICKAAWDVWRRICWGRLWTEGQQPHCRSGSAFFEESEVFGLRLHVGNC